MVNAKKAKRKSIAIPSKELQAFRRWFNKTDVATAVEQSGISFSTLYRIFYSGVASQVNSEKVKAVVERVNADKEVN